MDHLMQAVANIVEWTKLKCRIQSTMPRVVYFKEREVWWASIGANIGSEQNGKNARHERPILVLKKISTDMLWMLPMTTSQHGGAWYFPTAHEIGDRRQVVALSQIRAISAKRLIKKQRTLPSGEFQEIRARMRNFL